MRLIDADALNTYDVSPAYGMTVIGLTEEDIELAPTVDAEPVRHGRWKKAEPHGVWVYSDAYRQCSECNAVIYRALKMNYCPNCGANMDGERKEE